MALDLPSENIYLCTKPHIWCSNNVNKNEQFQCIHACTHTHAQASSRQPLELSTKSLKINDTSRNTLARMHKRKGMKEWESCAQSGQIRLHVKQCAQPWTDHTHVRTMNKSQGEATHENATQCTEKETFQKRYFSLQFMLHSALNWWRHITISCITWGSVSCMPSHRSTRAAHLTVLC